MATPIPQKVDDAAVTLGTDRAALVGGVAVETDSTDPTSVSAEGDAALLRTDRNRRLLVNDFHPNHWHATGTNNDGATFSAAQTNVSIKVTPGASLSLYVTDILLSNGATTGIITLLDGSAGTVIVRVYCTTNSGAVMNLKTPIRLTANTALCMTSTTVTTHSVTVCGFIAP
jgi:hypothetical protein